MDLKTRKTFERFLKATQKPKVDVRALAFPKQRAFIEDTSRLKALFCTRRAAKSYTAGLSLIHKALTVPGSNGLFVALTRESAKGIIWKDILKDLNRKLDLKAEFNGTALTMTLPNESVIWVTGADADEDEMNKLLGKKYAECAIDEASMFSINMHQLVYGVLKPATADLRGTIALYGTSSNITRGLFFDVTTKVEPGWSLHTWSAYDNPHIAAQWAEEIADIQKNRPLFMETALFKQWYLNQWVVDEDALCYKFNPARNLASSLPPVTGHHRYVLGVDLGHSPDPSAFVVGAYSDESPTLYFVHAEKHLKFDVTDVANKIKELDAKYNFDVKVIDNANKQAVAELNNRHSVNVIAADKTGKVDFINLMNTEFIQGMIKALPATKELQDEWSTLVWETDNGKIKEPRKEHPSLPNHLTDAALYLWRHCFQYLFKPKDDCKDSSLQEVWEPKHIKALEEAIQIEKNPDHISHFFDQDLFDMSLDDTV